MWQAYIRWCRHSPGRARVVQVVLMAAVAALVGVLFLIFRSAWQQGDDALLGVAIGAILVMPLVFYIDSQARRARAEHHRKD